MAKNKDLWMQKYTYDQSNPVPLPIKMHPVAAKALDEFCYHLLELEVPTGLFTVEIEKFRRYQFEELNAVALDVLSFFNFLGLRPELYLSYRDKKYAFRNPPSLITLDINFGAPDGEAASSSSSAGANRC